MDAPIKEWLLVFMSEFDYRGISLEYNSSLIQFQCNQDMAKGITLGRRLPTASLIRATDWRPMDLQDTANFNGKYRLYILPGDANDLPTLNILSQFCFELKVAMASLKLLPDEMEIFMIFDNDKSIMLECKGLPLDIVDNGFDRWYILTRTSTKIHASTFQSLFWQKMGWR